MFLSSLVWCGNVGGCVNMFFILYVVGGKLQRMGNPIMGSSRINCIMFLTL